MTDMKHVSSLLPSAFPSRPDGQAPAGYDGPVRPFSCNKCGVTSAVDSKPHPPSVLFAPHFDPVTDTWSQRPYACDHPRPPRTDSERLMYPNQLLPCGTHLRTPHCAFAGCKSPETCGHPKRPAIPPISAFETQRDTRRSITVTRDSVVDADHDDLHWIWINVRRAIDAHDNQEPAP